MSRYWHIVTRVSRERERERSSSKTMDTITYSHDIHGRFTYQYCCSRHSYLHCRVYWQLSFVSALCTERATSSIHGPDFPFPKRFQHHSSSVVNRGISRQHLSSSTSRLWCISMSIHSLVTECHAYDLFLSGHDRVDRSLFALWISDAIANLVHRKEYDQTLHRLRCVLHDVLCLLFLSMESIRQWWTVFIQLQRNIPFVRSECATTDSFYHGLHHS